MIDFQAAEKQRVGEPASDIGLEPLCAMVCQTIWLFKWHYYHSLVFDKELYLLILPSDKQQPSLLWPCHGIE